MPPRTPARALTEPVLSVVLFTGTKKKSANTDAPPRTPGLAISEPAGCSGQQRVEVAAAG
jgi:hypothetical protein